MTDSGKSITTAIAWCLAWGEQREPTLGLNTMQSVKKALEEKTGIPDVLQPFVEQVSKLNDLKFPDTAEELSQIFENLQKENSKAWNTSIGLVYGGATKIKQYVFEAAKLPDIRGASGLLDRINLIDLPGFFSCENDSNFPQCQRASDYCQKVRREWLDRDKTSPKLSEALISELIIYSTGGNILAFCPAAFVDDLANAIEKRYTEETLTANSCAVGDTFRLLEIRFGLLHSLIDQTKWLDWYLDEQTRSHPLVEAYFGCPEVGQDWKDLFENRKNFNELAGKLAALFNKRRNGNDQSDIQPDEKRPSRRYPPMFETHPYIRRDAGDRRSAVLIVQPPQLPKETRFSEALIRKRLVSELAKKESNRSQLPDWYPQSKFEWEPSEFESWVSKFKRFLYDNPHRYYENIRAEGIEPWKVDEAKSVREIANASKPQGFVAYIYADGNNMGGYIQKEIKTPEKYKQFSKDIFEATEDSTYEALAQHLKPHKLNNLNDPDNRNRNGTWIHPFEIITIGGDDVLLIVPADKALAIANTLGEEFENQLLKPEKQRRYAADKGYDPKLVHRYQAQHQEKQPSGLGQCKLSMSIGVLITAEDTPIYYAEDLTNQLLKSAKKRAKELKKKDYCGGTIDFLVMKSVTMISSNIGEFRSQGLMKSGPGQQKLKLYAAPYTLYELGGLLETAKVLKEADFPRSQLYQVRSFLEQGKNTAILNYRYFRTRLQDKKHQQKLEETFEKAWCGALTNNGNLAPWMTDIGSIIKNIMLLLFFETFPPEQVRLQYAVLSFLKTSSYETIWRELVDLYPFIEESKTPSTSQQTVIERK